MLDIIMACHNKLGYTIRAVEALKAYTVGEYRLTVVDDSTDLTPAYFRTVEGVNYIRPDIPITEGNQNVNIGLRNTQSNPVVFMAQNTFVEPGWNELPPQIIQDNEKVALVGAKLLYQNGIIEHAGMMLRNDNAICDLGRNEPGHRYSRVNEVPAVGFALVFINREAFPNGFPEKLYPHGFAGPDDMDACFDARKRGWKVVYCGMCCAYHLANAVRNKGADYERKVQESYGFFLSRWGTSGSQL